VNRVEKEKERRNQELREFIENVHGKWINESDFSNLSLADLHTKARGDRAYEAILQKQND
jgi:hypothetical protein